MAGGAAGKIFINYRRGEDSAAAGRLYDRLEQDFAKDDLFMDVDDIAAGQDFVAVLERQVAGCYVFLAVIGRSWLDVADAGGKRRLDSPNDFVRIEIASALRLGKRVIPVLVNDGRMPSADALPEPLKPLSRRNAVRLSHERFKADAHGLLNGLKAALAEAEAERTAHTEAERLAAEVARKAREAEEEARAAQLERETAERAKAGLTPEEIRKAEELANWDFIKDSKNAEDFRDHLARFAGGGTDRYARTKLEALVWADPATQAGIEALRTFLDEFPKGENAAAAKARLETLEQERAAARRGEEKQRAETEAWAKVAASTLIADFEAFLKQWPDGAHAADAKARMKELRGSRFTRRGVLKGFGIGAAVTTAGGGILYSALEPGALIWRQLHDRPSTLTGHTKFVLSVAFSPDGRTLASASSDATIKLWEVATGLELRTLAGHTKAVFSVAFSPDGRTLASGSWDKTIKLWEVTTGRELRTFANTSNVETVVFSPDGRMLASPSHDGTIKLWEVMGGQELRSFSGYKGVVRSLAFSPDGRTLASPGGFDKTIKLWDVASGQELRTLTGRTAYYMASVAFSPDGRTLASGGMDYKFSPEGQQLSELEGALRLWEVTTGLELRTFSGYTGDAQSLAFSPDGRTLASADSNYTMITLWEVASGRELQTLTGHTKFIRSIAFSPDGRTLASGSEDNTIKLWDVSPYTAAAR
ncbi:MAG: toll/interleukin-1 receptor domain-containing protein [Rhodomicrobium sp.]